MNWKKNAWKIFSISVGINADAATATKQIYDELKKQKTILQIENWTTNYLNERNNFLKNREVNNLGKTFLFSQMDCLKN